MTMMLGWVPFAAAAPEANPSPTAVATTSARQKRAMLLNLTLCEGVSCAYSRGRPRSARAALVWNRGRLGGDGLGVGADVADLGRRAVEFLVRHHRRPLEGKLAIDLHPRATP